MNTPDKVRFGYRRDASGTMVKDHAEQEIIKSIIHWRDQGLGPGHIASALNAEGLPAKRGKQWYAGAVSNILGRLQAEADKKAGITRTAEVVFEKPRAGVLSEDFTCADGSVIRVPVGSAAELREHGRVLVAEEPFVNRETGRVKRGKGGSMTVEDFKNMEARTMAEERLSVVERAERVRFDDPKSWGDFGDVLYPEVISESVLAATAKAMEGLQATIDRIKDQPSVKRDLRNEVKALFHELSAERQFRLHLLARLRTCDHQDAPFQFLDLISHDAGGNPVLQFLDDPDNPKDRWIVGPGGRRVRASEYFAAVVRLQTLVSKS